MLGSSFKDPDGIEWKLRLTVGAVTDVKAATGVDIGTVTKSDAAWVQFLFGDSEKLVALLWVLCEKQASERGVTPEAFARLFDGTTLEAAGSALAGAIADFFPRSRVAAAIRQSLGRILEAADEKGIAEINATTEQFCRSVGNSQESLESIPQG